MHRRLAPAVVGLVTFFSVACSSSASPAEPEAPSAEPPPTPNLIVGRVTSERFGWSVELPPPEWRYRPATEDWPAHTNPLPGAAYTDNFERPGESFPAFDVSTHVLPPDQTQDAFLSDLDEFSANLGCEVEETGEITVDGTVGRLQTQSCAFGGENVWEVIVFDGGRVYAIYWVGRTDDAAADEPVFRGIMETFAFAP